MCGKELIGSDGWRREGVKEAVWTGATLYRQSLHYW